MKKPTDQNEIYFWIGVKQGMYIFMAIWLVIEITKQLFGVK